MPSPYASSGGRALRLGQVSWLDQTDESARIIESEQRIYADDDWLEPDTNEGPTGVVRLENEEFPL